METGLQVGAKRAVQRLHAMHWPRVHELKASAGIWLTATESKISAALWALWLGRNLAFFKLIIITESYQLETTVQ